MIHQKISDSQACEFCMLSTICAQPMPGEPCHCTFNTTIKQAQVLKRKELLYSYHDNFKCLYAVNTGAIKTFQIDINGQERIHQFYLPGEIIGLEAISLGYYPYSAIALTASSVCEVPYNHLLDFISGYPPLQRHLMTSISCRINMGEYVTAASAEQRLAAFLLDIAKRTHNDKLTEAIELPMSRYDIGNYLNLAPETISRLFTRFQQAELIQVQNKEITLIDPTNLQWMAKDGIKAS